MGNKISMSLSPEELFEIALDSDEINLSNLEKEEMMYFFKKVYRNRNIDIDKQLVKFLERFE